MFLFTKRTDRADQKPPPPLAQNDFVFIQQSPPPSLAPSGPALPSPYPSLPSIPPRASAPVFTLQLPPSRPVVRSTIPLPDLTIPSLQSEVEDQILIRLGQRAEAQAQWTTEREKALERVRRQVKAAQQTTAFDEQFGEWAKEVSRERNDAPPPYPGKAERELKEMGFELGRARKALEVSKGDLDAALEILINEK